MSNAAFFVWDLDNEDPDGLGKRNQVLAFCAESAAEAYAECIYGHDDYFEAVRLMVKAPTGEITCWTVEVEHEPTFTAEAVPACRDCGCTEDRACEGGCTWVAPDLCSMCAGPVEPWEKEGQA